MALGIWRFRRIVSDGIMNRKLRTALAALGSVIFFVLFKIIFPTLGILGAVVGFIFVWFFAGFLHWLYSKRIHYTKQWYRFSDDESQNEENLR
jgi:Ca2+/Na+ antiporter